MERKRNPGAVLAVRVPDFAALHPGYKTHQCASAVVINNRTGSSTYFITADW
jgi:hypothetical protein